MAEAQKKPFDFILLMTVIIMLAFGIIMVLSASSPYAAHYKDDSLYYLKSQLRAVGIGLVFMLIFMNVNYKIYAKFSPVIMFGSLVLLVMVLIPGIGQEINGARRWMFGFQPSEFAKLAVILFFSYSLSKNKRQLNSFVGGFLPYLVLIGIYAALLMKEPHLSGTIIIGAIALIIMCCAGAKLFHYFIIAVPVAIIGIIAVVIEPYRLNRIISFLDPWKYSRTIGWQIINSLYAIGSGGIFGRGLGKSMQKYLYIPEPHTDFIFSVMAEEVGLIGVVLVMALFAVFIWRGLTSVTDQNTITTVVSFHPVNSK